MSQDGFKQPQFRANRRKFIQAAGGTVAVVAGAIPFSQSQAAARKKWDHEADVVIVGSGAAGLTAAVIAASEGAKVLVLESAPIVGGTSARSGGGFWIPNNRHMRARGQTDPRDDAIRYMIRYSFTQLYNPAAKNYGVSDNAYQLAEAMYDNAALAMERLEELGALYTAGDYSYDHWDSAPENKAPYGRNVWSVAPSSTPKSTQAALDKAGAAYAQVLDSPSSKPRPASAVLYPATAVTPEWWGLIGAGNRGSELIRQFKAWLDLHQVPILVDHRAVRLVTNGNREVIGVETTTDEGKKTVTVRARKAVHFGTGGFTHNEDLRLNFQRGPVFSSCSTLTNQGDLVYMATDVGAKLGNMQNAWHLQAALEQVLDTPSTTNIWGMPGDGMFLANKYGKRVVNEKRPYSDRAEIHYIYDPTQQEWTNLVLFMIFDQRVADVCAGRYPYPPKDKAAPYIVRGESLDELAAEIGKRLTKLAPRIGGFNLDLSFTANLRETVARFNSFAKTGVDEDFQRGKFRFDQQSHKRFSGDPCFESNQLPNKTMHFLAPKGPYYAILLAKAQSDTCGGPVINAKAQILSARDKPIPGLYGAGNCIAAPSGRAWWGAGGSLGPAMTFGYIAGKNAAKEPLKKEI